MDLRRQTEVQHLHIAHTVDHDVPRLDVPVDDLLRVGVIQCLGDLPDNRRDHLLKIRTLPALAPEPVTQIFPFHVLHNKKVTVGLRIQFQRVVIGNVRVMKLLDQLEVVQDLFHFPLAVRQFRRESLDRIADMACLVLTLVNDPHAPFAQFGKDFVASQNQIPCRKASIRLTVPVPGHGLVKLIHHNSLPLCCF